MASSEQNITFDDLLARLLAQAKLHWGEGKAEKMGDALEVTANQIFEVSTHLPDKETEPAFYQQ